MKNANRTARGSIRQLATRTERLPIEYGMPTHSQRFQESLARWRRLADDFEIHGFEISKARHLTMEVGSRTEALLKTAVLPHISPRATFNDCINALEPLGIDQPHRDKLHDLRQLYNAAKHDPQRPPSLLDLKVIIPQVSEVIRRMTESSIGLLNAEKQTRFHRSSGSRRGTTLSVEIQRCTSSPRSVEVILRLSIWST